MRIINRCSMKDYTSFKVGGSCRALILIDEEDELLDILHRFHREKQRFIVLGNGSNTIFSDRGYDGTVIKLGSAFAQVTVEGQRLVAGGASLLSKVSRIAAREGLTGMEAISGIPGSVGGAVFMNAGAYGGEMSNVVEKVYAVKRDGSDTYWIHNEELKFGYRTSMFKETGDVVLKVVFSLAEGKEDEIQRRMEEFSAKRNAKQPLTVPSCGSFFKRPTGNFAGSLIEKAGLSGFSVGDAQVSEKHCGFIINRGDATATDVLKLKEIVQQKVFEQFGVLLEPEVRIIDEGN